MLKKIGIFGLGLMVLGGLLLGNADALSRLRLQPSPVYSNDGNRRTGVTASCTSSAWTQVVAANSKRRRLILRSDLLNSAPLCLGTDDAGGTCSTAQLGRTLGTSEEYQDSSEAKLYCRSVAGTQVIKGFDLDDSTD